MFRDNESVCIDDLQKAELSMETSRPNNQPPWDSDATNWGIVGNRHMVNNILRTNEGVYYSGHGNRSCIWLNTPRNLRYCVNDVPTRLQTRLFVVSACYAGGNEFGRRVRDRGVTCVVGASGTINDTWWDECGNWADLFWDRATGNRDAGYQRTAHEARVEANAATLLNLCDLDREIGNCNIRI